MEAEQIILPGSLIIIKGRRKRNVCILKMFARGGLRLDPSLNSWHQKKVVGASSGLKLKIETVKLRCMKKDHEYPLMSKINLDPLFIVSKGKTSLPHGKARISNYLACSGILLLMAVLTCSIGTTANMTQLLISCQSPQESQEVLHMRNKYENFFLYQKFWSLYIISIWKVGNKYIGSNMLEVAILSMWYLYT